MSEQNKARLGGGSELEARWTPALAVSGVVFADLDADGVRDAGEGGIAGVRVFADANSNGVRDAGEATAVTAGYTFLELFGQRRLLDTAGGYTLSGFGSVIGPGAPFRDVTGPIRVELPAGAAVTRPAPVAPAGGLFVGGVNVGVGGLAATPRPNVPTVGERPVVPPTFTPPRPPVFNPPKVAVPIFTPPALPVFVGGVFVGR